MASSRMQKVYGDLYLAWRGAVAHPLRKLFKPEERTGKRRFLDNYGSEGLLPMTTADREVLRGAARCIHCGLCDAYDLALATVPRTAYDGASLLPVQYARATPDLPHAREALRKIDEAKLIRAEAVCPTRVPLRQIATYLKRKLSEIEHEQASTVPEATENPAP